MKNIILLASAVFLLASAAHSTAAVIHVPADQTTIQAGIDTAVNGDTVLVADGIYTGAGNRDIEFRGKAIIVRSEHGPDDCIVDCQGSPSEQHRGFFFHENETRDALLEGFTIRNGYLDEFGQYGGGIMVSGGADPTIRGNLITGNTSDYGGGIACFSTVNPLIIENRIEKNQAEYGGGIYGAPSSMVEIIDNLVSGNSAIVAAGGVQCRGDQAVVTGNTITGNQSAGTVGGMAVSSGNAIVIDNLVANNSSVTWVGGMTATGREVLAANNVVLDNQTDGDVGGMAFGSDMIGDGGLMINNLVAGNIAAGDCGGLQFQHSESTVICNTITGNISGQNTGGILILDSYFSDSVITFADNVIWGNSAPGGYEIRMEYNVSHYNPPILQIGHSTLEGGLAAIDVCTQCEVIWGDGMLESDPLFVSGSAGDFYLSQTAAGQPGQSPCVDAGNDAAANIGYETPYGPVSLADLTTRTDRVDDSRPGRHGIPLRLVVGGSIPDLRPGIWRPALPDCDHRRNGQPLRRPHPHHGRPDQCPAGRRPDLRQLAGRQRQPGDRRRLIIPGPGPSRPSAH